MDFANSPNQISNRTKPRENSRIAAWHIPFLIWELIILILLVSLALVVHLVREPLLGDDAIEVAWQKLILPHQTVTQIIDFASTINWPNYAMAGVVVIVIALLLLRRWAAAGVAAVTSGLGDASSYLTNQLVQRPRPSGHGIYILQHINNYYSFPSGHVVHVIAFFGFVLYVTFQTKHRNWWLWLIRIPLILMIVFIAPSRVLEGEHWPSDVLGGLLLGGFWLILGTHVYNWIHRASHVRKKFPFSSEDEVARFENS